jgi:hypothetical protein
MSKNIPVTEEYVDDVMGCMADGPDLLAAWRRGHRKEGERSEQKYILSKSQQGLPFLHNKTNE